MTTKRLRREAIKALCWTAFSEGAGNTPFKALPIVVAVEDRGYFKTIAKNSDAGKFKDPAYLDNTLGCCRLTGRLAAKYAKADGKKKIGRTHFERAADEVFYKITNLVKKKKVVITGGVCF